MMKRRNFVMSVLAGGAAVAAPAGMIAADQDDHRHDHDNVEGPLANATVTFGSWHTVPTVNHFENAPAAADNVHKVLPFETTIKAGGSVNFAISGFHVLTVYGHRTTWEDISTTVLTAIPGAPATFPKVVNDPVNRVYWGNNPFPLPQDRIEAVNFVEPGRYLVVCTFLPHFNDRMFGFVRVLK
jgi:hypothetical protein